MKLKALFFSTFLITAVFIFPSLTLASSCPNPTDNPCWEAKAPMPTGRRDLGVATDAQGKIYAVGGTGSTAMVATLEVYDPTSDSWTTKTPAPIARNIVGFTFNPDNGKFYFGGGYNEGLHNDFYEYDPIADTWTQKAPMLTTSGGLSFAAGSNGKVYSIGGGYLNGTYVSNVEEYDPVADTWTIKSLIPTPRSDAALVSAENGKFYFIGGGAAPGVSVSSVDEYDPVADTWASKAPLPAPRTSHAASLNVNGNIYVVGGYNIQGGFFNDTVYEYNIATDTWDTKTSLPIAINSVRMALGGDGKVYVLGGWTATNGAVNTNYAGSIGVGVNQLTALSPAQVWVGLKNSDDVGVRFDLLAEVYKDNVLVSSGQLNSAPGGSSGFNNARLDIIPFNAFAPIDFPEGSELRLKLYVRNACIGSGHNSGVARLWFNDSAANSHFDATISTDTSDYFLWENFLLATTEGQGPKKTIDVQSGTKCSSFKTFGTWAITP